MPKHRHVWQKQQSSRGANVVVSRRCLECGETQVRSDGGSLAEGGVIPAGLPGDHLAKLGASVADASKGISAMTEAMKKMNEGPLFDADALKKALDAGRVQINNPLPRPAGGVQVQISTDGITFRDAYGIRGGFSPVPIGDESSFRNPEPHPVEVKMRDATPEEAFQIILKYLRWAKGEATPEEFRQVTGKWITKFTNEIVAIINEDGEE